VDLRLGVASRATDTERDAVDSVLGPPTSGWDGAARRPQDGHAAFGGRRARAQRHLLLPVLHAVQDRCGWISEGALDYVCTRLSVPAADAHGVASFYALLSLDPRPRVVAHVCDDIACRVRGGETLCRELEGVAGSLEGGSEGWTWARSPCLGHCDLAPVAFVQNSPRSGHLTLRGATCSAIRDAVAGPSAATAMPYGGPPGTPQRIEGNGSSAAATAPALLRRIGAVDPESLDSYRAHGGYQMLRRAIALGPAGVLREVTASKLLGRGGAAFPTGRKWEAVAGNPSRPHHIVGNADESEPGTFKDRILMEADPYALVEALTIGAFATGAEHGWVYVRGEYPLAEARLRHAVGEARSRGLLGPDVMGSGAAFDIEVRRGAGAYICGEETALFNSIEGHRGEPRNKPPFPTVRGLFGRPTVVNNVETLLNVLEILRLGGAAFATTGTPESTGTRLFCVCGTVERPGLYEVEFGVTIGELLERAGGVGAGRTLQAILLGGAAGTFVGPGALDTPLTFEGVRAIGATLGSGVVMAFDDTVDMADVCWRIARFFRDESCGQCVPCRVGTVRQAELLARVVAGRPSGSPAAERTLLGEIGQAMRDASICGLGQTAANAIESAMDLGLLGRVSP